MCRELHEPWEVLLECIVDIIVLIGRDLEFLLELEQVLLITQALLLLIPQFGERVVKSVIVGEFVVAFSNRLANDLENALKFLQWADDATLDKLELR